MKISLEWLAEFLPNTPGNTLTAQAAADALTHGGLPVEVIEQHGDDTVIDVEVTSNRGDCLSHRGVGRELAALLDRKFTDTPATAAESATAASSITNVRIDAANLCPHYTARIIRGVRIAPSPAWLVRRLEAIGLRAVNNVVDVTNYVLFELGQPLHAFDFDKLAGGQIIVRTAAAGESIVSLDGHERKLTPGMLVIADAARPVALAGVMGGRDSEVSDSTVNILLESARFDPLSVRKTARTLAMKSDSSYRFERGIDPQLPVYASLRAAQLILQTAGGELLNGYVEAGTSGYAPKQLALRAEKLRGVLGVDLPEAQVNAAFARLGFPTTHQPAGWIVTVPSYRLDINLEIDLVEEVARVIGYDKIPVRDEISIRLTPPNLTLKTIDDLRHDLAASGYSEAVTVSFVTDSLAADFKPAEAASLPRADSSVRKADAHLRPSMLPGLAQAVRHNESVGTAGARLFEIGSVFWVDSAAKVVEQRRLALIGGDLRDVRGTIETLLARLDATKPCTVIPQRCPGLSSAGEIQWNGQPIGSIGVIDKAVLAKLGLRETPAAAELELTPLLAGAQHVPQLIPLPRFPAIARDLTLDVPEKTRYSQVESLVRDLKLDHLEAVNYVTTYRGKQLEKGVKSVTITLMFRSATGTLTGEIIDRAIDRVVESAKHSLGAIIRA